jgi:hypothetical protein
MRKWKGVVARCSFVPILVLSILVLPAAGNCASPQNGQECEMARESAFPQASITNGDISAVVSLPDAKSGYYRGSRFDWSGVIRCLTYKKHTYFGVWFPRYDALLHDAITGPVDEFRTADDSAIGYGQAKAGELFVKPGVGVLRRVDDGPYKFPVTYPLVDGGKWTVRAQRSGVSFTQRLRGPGGVAYVYTKKLKLERNSPVLTLEHELRNTGTAPIETDVYNHDFFVIDNAKTGPGMVVRFPFVPQADPGLKNGARIEGKEILYGRELETGETVSSTITGYSGQVSDYDFFVENQNSGAGVEQSGDLPLAKLYFWSIRTTICPEAYVRLKIAPGESQQWTIRYRFYEK